MSTKPSEPAIHPSLPVQTIPLANGDRLSRDEFERRWEAMPELKHAELIDGVVYMAAAVRFDQHGAPHGRLLGWLAYYVFHTPGVEIGGNTSLRLDRLNLPQPDALLLVRPELGGQAKISEDGYLESAPELVCEVSASTSSIDLHDKLEVYRRHGVKEYVVWRVLDAAVDWFILRDGNYEKLAPPAGEPYQSTVFPGLWLDAPALISGDGKQLLATLQTGIESEEHAQFVKRLGQLRKPSD